MPKFFVPLTNSPDEAERIYAACIANASPNFLAKPHSRLFRIAFRHDGRHHVAEVGRDITRWPEPVGPVLAILEMSNIVLVHTQLAGGLSPTPILVSPERVSEHVYFDDYPVQP